MSFQKTAFPITFNEPSDWQIVNNPLGHPFGPAYIIGVKSGLLIQVPVAQFSPAVHNHVDIYTQSSTQFVRVSASSVNLKHTAGILFADFSGWLQLKGLNTTFYTQTVYCGTLVESSSRALKKDIVDIEDTESKVKLLKPKKYKFNGKETYGFLLEECPEQAVYTDTLESGEIQQGVKSSSLLAMLWRTVQKILLRLDVLESKK